MPLMNYDHAVTYYDTTRAYPDGVPEQIRDSIIQHLEPNMSMRFLELAIGTGIIGIPFIEQGYNYTGVDISAQMMFENIDKVKHINTTSKTCSNQYYATLALCSIIL